MFFVGFQNSNDYRAFFKYVEKKIQKGLIDKLYIRHLKYQIKDDKGEFTAEAKRYIDVINNELVLKFDEKDLEPEVIDKNLVDTLDISSWSFSAEELKHISGIELLKFIEEDEGINILKLSILYYNMD